MSVYLVFKRGSGYVVNKQPDTVKWTQARGKAARYEDKERAKVVARNVGGQVVEE